MSGKQLDPEKCDVQVEPGAIVCIEVEYVGKITIGARTVIHPKARIIAEAGPIVIGDGNLIEEQAEIINKAGSGEGGTLYIGNHNVFEVGSKCYASKVGDNNVLEAKCFVGPRVELTKGCVIGPLCSVTAEEKLPENTVVYGDAHSRRVQAERPAPQGLQLDFLTKILPNFHDLVKPKRKQPVPS